MNRKILITGATGDTGRAAVKESLRLGLDVRAMVRRRDDRSDALAALGAEIVLGDLLAIDSLVAAMTGTDSAYLVCPVAPGLIQATANFALAAKETELSAVVNLAERTTHRYAKSDLSKDHFIGEQILNWSGLNVTHLRPTLFLEWLLYPWQVPLMVERGILRMPVGRARHAAISAEDQGRVIAAILRHPSRHAGKTYPLFGPVEMDHDQMAAELSVALGRKIVFEDTSIGAYAETLKSAGLPDFQIRHISASMQDYRDGAMAGMNDHVETITGQKPMSVQEFARAHLATLNPSKRRADHSERNLS